MTTTTYSKLKKEIKEELFKEFIAPILEDIKDAEGEYRKNFVKEILKSAKEKPIYKYDKKTFAKLVL